MTTESRWKCNFCGNELPTKQKLKYLKAALNGASFGLHSCSDYISCSSKDIEEKLTPVIRGGGNENM